MRLSPPVARLVRRAPLPLLLAAILAGAAAGNVEAQVESPSAPRPQVTRADLERATARLDSVLLTAHLPGRSRVDTTAELTLLRERLRDGDFAPGDRIVLRVLGEAALTDTFTVEPGRRLALSGLEPLSLAGVLRSELKPVLVAHIARFIRNPEVDATPLVRVALLGAVARPGFYVLPPGSLLTDAIMLAGGPAGNAELDKTVVRRDARELMSAAATRNAIGRGLTLDQLNLRAGDEIVVAEKKERSTQVYISTIALIVTTITGLIAMQNR